jgi:hypothetical protein
MSHFSGTGQKTDSRANFAYLTSRFLSYVVRGLNSIAKHEL